jgi:hypothetical protein
MISFSNNIFLGFRRVKRGSRYSLGLFPFNPYSHTKLMENRKELERFDLALPATVEFINQNYKGKELNPLASDICSGGEYLLSRGYLGQNRTTPH